MRGEKKSVACAVAVNVRRWRGKGQKGDSRKIVAKRETRQDWPWSRCGERVPVRSPYSTLLT